MMTQETTSVKTWEGFNLAILKVNLNPLYERIEVCTIELRPLTFYCYPPVKLTDTTMCKLRIHGLLLSWILQSATSSPLVYL